MRFIHSVARIEGGCQIFVCVLMQAKWNDRCTVQFFQFILFLFFLENMTIELAFVVLCPYHSASSAAAHCYATLCLFLVSFSLEKIVCYLLPSTNPFLWGKKRPNTSQRYLFYLLKFQHSMRPNPINFRLWSRNLVSAHWHNLEEREQKKRTQKNE